MPSKRCSRCKQIKVIVEFHKNRSKPDGLSHACKQCYTLIRHEDYLRNKAKRKSYTDAYNRKNRKRVNAYASKRRTERKIELVKLAGGKCIVCNYNRCLAALDFHHIDPKNKTGIVGRLVGSDFKTRMEEIKKCVLLCCRCHREFHAGMIQLPKMS
jgi:hypothetical protein